MAAGTAEVVARAGRLMTTELAIADDALTIEFDCSGDCPDLTPDEAEAVTGRIRRWVNNFPIEDVVLAFRGRVWIALAYDNWAQWCECELGGLKLPAPKRREVVAELADAGMSNRAIADTIGSSHTTVNNDLRESTGSNFPVGRKTLGQDGRERTNPQPKPAAPQQPNAVIDAEIVCRDCDGYGCETCFPESASVSGSPEPEVSTEPEASQPHKPRRRPLEEGFFDATMRLNKAVTSLENLGKDDRLPRNKNQVARYRHDLIRASDALQRVADQLA